MKTIDRIVSVFPAGEQEGVRNVLADTLRAVVAQQLVPKVGGGRVAALEILFSSPAIGNMIREGKTGQIISAIQSGVNQGMIEMDASIRALYEEGMIDAGAAIDKAIDKELLQRPFGRARSLTVCVRCPQPRYIEEINIVSLPPVGQHTAINHKKFVESAESSREDPTG